MPNLLADTAEVIAWVDQAIAANSGNSVFGKLVSAVIWSDAAGPDGELLVPMDPQVLVAKINPNGFPLLNGHDPGFPLGRVLTAAEFTCSNGKKFVAAILGFYAGGTRLRFSDLGIDPAPAVSWPATLPALAGDCWINFATDPREVESEWLDDVLRSAPLRVDRTELSHNAAESVHELMRVGVLLVFLVWNPFIKTVVTEAGKDAYAAMHNWMRSLLNKLAERRNPVLDVIAHQEGCQISFLFRGKDVKRSYAAHDALSTAAVQAASLVSNMKARGVAPQQIVYEFDPQENRWFPSYAELCDGRFVSDNNVLIAMEQLPTGVSLGMSRGEEQLLLPSFKDGH